MIMRRVSLGMGRQFVGKPAAFSKPVARNMSGVSSLPSTLMSGVWRKSNILYITYIVGGCVVLEAIYGSFTNAIWDAYNHGVSKKLSVNPYTENHHFLFRSRSISHLFSTILNDLLFII